ncbi:Phosphoglucomutase [Vulcanisaeta moutnovskia 768-28]|uniref:Phosphoglucomutase n=1 Tax=Vulcanisaeta moutnovskia (strain 768-28) TaxID=985053 RepID=F0QXE9_VULM7|nr:phosphoglucomutase [Vulcanisaeta moutnovskia]ADY01188.1 Phosphoglucomutase [Vulcanisaeta moutnovskia 768-28]
MGNKLTFHFGTDGVRGVIDEEFTEFLVAVLAESTFRYWSRKYGLHRVLVSFDARRKSRDFAHVAASVAVNHGLDVVIVNKPTPTPTAAWFGSRFGFDLIIQITASHNPPIYNGFKVITSKGSPVQEEDTNQIEKLYSDEYSDITRSVKTLELRPIPTIDPAPEYINYVYESVTKMFKPRNRFKVIIDPIYATSIGYTSEVLRRLGMDVMEIHNNYDSNFGGRDPNPEPQNIPELVQEVTAGKYDVGISHDGDSDRIALVDRVHGYLSANDILPIVVERLASASMIKRGIVRTVSTTHILDNIAAKYGFKVVEVPVGVKYVARAILSGEADMGGEESGGLVYSWHIPDKDGIYTASLIVVMASEYGSLTSLVSNVRSKYGRAYFKRVDLDMRNSKKFVNDNKEELLKLLSSLGPNPRPITIDGVKVVFSDGSWILIRGSGTEPKLRIYSEALSMDRVEELINNTTNIVNQLLKQ